MDPIFVPAPPHSAYNPNRRVSDLLLSQVKHFQHVELKRGDLGIDPQIARNVYTEGGAALYIAAVTKALRGVSRVVQLPKLTVMQSPRPAKKSPTQGLALAASAETTSSPTKNAPTPKAAKKLTPRKTAKKSAKKKP